MHKKHQAHWHQYICANDCLFIATRMKVKENAHIDTGIYNKNIISTSWMPFPRLSHISGPQFKSRRCQYLLQRWRESFVLLLTAAN